MRMVLGKQRDGAGARDAGKGYSQVQQTGGDPQQQGLSSLPPQDKPVVCLANQNGSQVECELGNPMKRGAQVGAAPRCPRSLVPGPGPSPLPSAPRCGSSSSSAPWASPSRPRTWRWSLPCPREPWGGRGPPRQSPTLGSVCLQWGFGVMPPPDSSLPHPQDQRAAWAGAGGGSRPRGHRAAALRDGVSEGGNGGVRDHHHHPQGLP